MVSVKVPPLISITAFGFLLSCLAVGAATASNCAGQEKISESEKTSESVVVVGKVFCDTCLEHRLSDNGYVISGASIAVECGLGRKAMSVSITGETNENGEFKVEIPSNIIRLADQLNNCWVMPRSSPLDSCSIPSMSAPSKLTLQSNANGVVTYSAGSFSYRLENMPLSCYSEEILTMIKGRAMAEDVDQSSKAGQQTPTIPSLPKLPPATLPSVPPLPKFSIPPLPKIAPLPQFSAPPFPKPTGIPGSPPMQIPSVPQIPQFPGSPPLQIPSVPQIPQFPGSPPLQIPSVPQIPQFPQIPNFQIPQIPNFQIPQIPNIQIPQIPFLTPPTPGQKNNP